jgi:hypothetical protein
MSVCDPANQIPSYTTVNDINCISLETLLLTTDVLIIGGVPYSSTSLNALLQKTQYQTTSVGPDQTTFTGTVDVSNISSNGGFLTTATLFCDNISSTSVTGNVVFSGPITTPLQITVSNTNLAGTTNVLSVLQPNLLVSNSVNLFLGSANTTSNGATATFNYLVLGSTTNNMVLKIVGATSQLSQSGLAITITGPLTLQTLQINPRTIMVGTTFSNTVTTSAYNFDDTVKRVDINLVNVIRKNPNNFESLIQFGVQPSTWDQTVGHYEGTNLGNDGSISVYWSVFPGAPLIDNWPTGGTYGDFLWSGRITLTYFGLIGGVHQWTIFGQLSTPSIVNVAGTNFGPYHTWNLGHYTTSSSTNANMVRLTCQDPSNTFQSGYMTITTE